MSGVDTVREVYTPEGVALRLPVAGPVPRAMAWIIDTVIRIAALIVLVLVGIVAGFTYLSLQALRDAFGA